MSISAADEKRLLAADELELVTRSHYPDISTLDRAELGEMAKRLRNLRDKARDVAHRQRREIRGKSDPRGTRPARDNTGTEMKRRALGNALKRVNRELARLAAADRKPPQAQIARRALDLKRANRIVHHPRAGRGAHGGMTPKPSSRATVESDPREIGRVSQFVKNAQAKRDS
ncbi:MAG: hypothetical protein ACXW25_01670 [Rhodospirillales bacterium]